MEIAVNALLQTSSHFRPASRLSSIGISEIQNAIEAIERVARINENLADRRHYVRASVRPRFGIVRSSGPRWHGGFTEGADSDLSDTELRAAGRHRSARQLPTYAKRTRKQLISGAQKRRAERTKPAGCRNSRRSFVGMGAWLDC